MQKGFVLQDIGKNNKNSMNIYIFNKTKGLEEKLQEYKSVK